MRKALWTLLALGASSLVKQIRTNPGNHMELARLKLSLLYLRSIKTFRLLFMSLLSMGVCLTFLLVGLILLHATLFLYAPWSIETKMLVGLTGSVAYLVAAFVMVSKTFASDKWLKTFHADTLTNKLNTEAQHDVSLDAEKGTMASPS